MATEKAEKVTAAAPSFPKYRILTFKRYANRRDLLSVLLEDDKEYTHEQVQKVLDDFKKGVH